MAMHICRKVTWLGLMRVLGGMGGPCMYALSWRNTDYIETMDICLQGHDNFLPKSFTHIIYVTRIFNS